MTEQNMVLPGDSVAEEEDWQQGEGVIPQNGNYVALVPGNVHFDSEANKVSVIPIGESVRKVEVGDFVIASIWKLKESMVEATILEVEGKEHRSLLPEQLNGHMHVTKLVNRYMHETRDAIRRRDIIRAKVTQSSPVVRIEMRDNEGCGVIHAICPQCGETLQPFDSDEDWNVECGECTYVGFRALSDGYGLGYEVQENGVSKLNNAGKRWGAAAEALFAKGPAARSNLISADHRNDGIAPKLMQFGDGGRGGRGGGGRTGGRPRVQGRKLFVGGIARGVETPELEKLFSAHGKVVDAIVMIDKETGNSRGFGFVTFAEDADAEKAINALHKYDLKGRKISVNDADKGKKDGGGRGGRGGRGERPARPDGTRMYIGGLPWSMDNDGLKTLFSKHGSVLDVHIVMDRNTDRSKGFGFVTMSEAEAKTAISEIDGFKVEGRTLKVQVANDKGGNGGGRRGGGRERGGRGKGGSDRGGGKDQRSSREMQARREEGLN